MTRSDADFIFFVSLGAWLAIMVGFVGETVFTTKMTLDVIRSRQVAPEEPNKYDSWKLLRLHRSMFPASNKRKFFWISQTIFIIAMLVEFLQSTLPSILDRLHHAIPPGR
jgi:hypothetical protein